MSIILDYQLREYIPHNVVEFPITYFHDELADLPNWVGPLHWHPEFEIATAEGKVLDYQVGEHHVILEAGDSICQRKYDSRNKPVLRRCTRSNAQYCIFWYVGNYRNKYYLSKIYTSYCSM